MSDPAAPTPAVASEADAAAPAQDEDFSKEYEPVVRLAEVETKTGEEDEDVLFKIRAKLFRFSKDLKEWKERGTGDVRLLKHRQTSKIRLLMRREKTLKICLNHYVNPTVELTENVGSDRSWVWPGVDYADGDRDEALLAIRFRDSANANLFKEAYDKARTSMTQLATNGDPHPDTSASADAAAPDSQPDTKDAEENNNKPVTTDTAAPDAKPTDAAANTAADATA